MLITERRSKQGCRQRRLDIAGVVDRDAIEAVSVATDAGENGRRLRAGILPECEGTAVVRDIDSIGRDAWAAGVVLTRPAYSGSSASFPWSAAA